MKKYTLLLISLFAFTICTMAQFRNEAKPMYSDTLLFENWSSGSFATNQWIVNPIDPYVLKVSSLDGNPAPSAEFSLYEFITCTITSREITGTNKYTELRYDISVSASSYATFFSGAEIYDGNIWHTIDVVEGTGDSIPWETRVVNISPYCQNNFKIRFHSVGQDIPSGHLNIDNILIGSFPLGITEHQNTDFIIKPNPAKSSFDVVLKNFENQNTQVIISDVTGKVVHTEEFICRTIESTKRISTDHLSRGIYFCKIQSGKANLIRKVILE